ncbi:MAG: 50S ribosomal protein L17 [Lentisphaeria bacterium]|nr:50S ribosomal protein L17 [Lentisphaeria bacterium]
MRHKKRTFKLGRTGAHRAAMLANMSCSLVEEGRIKTTVPKARGLQRFAEKLVTLAKKGDLHSRRQAASKMRQPKAVQVLFDELAPKFANRQGGYTRIIKCGRRLGDAAEMCFIELIDVFAYEAPATETEVVTEEVAETTEA